MNLTDNIQLILDALRTSALVEVQGDKVRRRNDWIRWLLPSAQFTTATSPQSLGRFNRDTLASHLQSFTLDDKNAIHGLPEVFLSRSSSGELSSQSQQSGGESTSQVIVQAGFEHTTSAGFSSK
ncbi:unnamed protein product [Ilex paraguariensis]|uniref:HTH La-type RNA-binding domain-containing protein n=1 Tax=Ilex paraguariensis TaxID=185542 RepID=A0ABC8SIE4_9AQUA